jgi:23S rRNA pseudouridine1911/1915/1917 synthase
MTGPRTLTLEVRQGEGGGRLDRFLSSRLADRSRSALRRLILEGHVRVNGRTAAKPGLSLADGTRVELSIPEPSRHGPQPEQIPLSVLYEDDALLVIDKPAGLVVHPGHGHTRGTLVHALLGRGTTLAPAGGLERPGIVHRLDRGTSGLLVVARTDAAYRALTAAFARRDVQKRYVALVWGHPRPTSGTIERPIGRSRANRIKMAAGVAGARPALTRYRVTETMPGFARLDVHPVTGRTHQIRVHLYSIQHSVVGDDRYGGRSWKRVRHELRRRALQQFGRLALHAAELAFAHPTSGRPMHFQSPLPAELELLLRQLRAPVDG